MNVLLIDNLTRIQNGIKFKSKYVKVKRNKLTMEVLNLLYKNGFINGFFCSEQNPYDIFVYLKYVNSKPVFKKFKYFSKPSRMIYCSALEIKKNLLKNGFFVISTSCNGLFLSGFLSDNFYNFKNGGTLLFQVIL